MCIMATGRDVFSISGPKHLAHVDWKNPDHRRSVAASLVRGASILERDRQQNRWGINARASHWWEFFQFQLIRPLVDDADSSIFGAIYELKSPTRDHKWWLVPEAPKYVVAFRGSILKFAVDQVGFRQVLRDLKLNIRVLGNGLHCSSRFKIAMQAVRGVVSTNGHQNIWLAGHSLGSAVAMLVGKNMAKEGIFLQAFLFSPPFASAPIELIKDENLKQAIKTFGNLFRAGAAIVVKGPERHLSEESFVKLSPWVPCLFVNQEDPLCAGYVEYFEQRKRMEEVGAGEIGRLATKHSLCDIFLTAMGKESEPLHLLPSANLTINLSPSADFKKNHGIHQWWSPHCQFKCMSHRYK